MCFEVRRAFGGLLCLRKCKVHVPRDLVRVMACVRAHKRRHPFVRLHGTNGAPASAQRQQTRRREIHLQWFCVQLFSPIGQMAVLRRQGLTPHGRSEGGLVCAKDALLLPAYAHVCDNYVSPVLI